MQQLTETFDASVEDHKQAVRVHQCHDRLPVSRNRAALASVEHHEPHQVEYDSMPHRVA